MQLHGFFGASELAYGGVVYSWMVNLNGDIHTAHHVLEKGGSNKVKGLTIPRLELCGAHLLAQLLHHCKVSIYPLMTSLHGLTVPVCTTHRFKAKVGNRVSCIVELTAPECWNHVGYRIQPTAHHRVYSHQISWITACGEWTRLASTRCRWMALTTSVDTNET